VRAVISFTRPALTTRHPPGHHDTIAGLQVRDSSTHLLNDSGAFVTQKDRELITQPSTVPDVGVGVAHATGQHTHDDFTGAWVVEIELVNYDRLTCRK
jgi:hypothetical protein